MSQKTHARTARSRSQRRRPVRKTRIRSLETKHRQWELKAGFADDGTMITLRDFVSCRTPPKSIESLTEHELRELTVARLRCFPDYCLRVLGRRRPVSQRTAIREVRKGTTLGKFLVETEQNIIRLLLERIRLGKTSRGMRNS